MNRKQLRLSLDPAVWQAAEAAARVKGVPVHLFAEEALKAALWPFDSLAQAGDVARELAVNATSIRDQLQVIADFIVDAHATRTGDRPEF